MSLIIPSYKTGFARNAAESEYPDLWKSLRGSWHPSLGPTGLTLYDWSGYGNDGTLTNMDPATDWVTDEGWALAFNGSSNGVTIPLSSLTGATRFTIACRLKAPGTEDADVICEHSANFNNSAGSFLVHLDGGSLYIVRRTAIGGNLYNGGNRADFGNGRTALTVSFDEVALGNISEKVYFNGTEQVITNVTHDKSTIGLAVPDDSLYLASRAGSSLFLACTISEFSIYDRILAPAEIQQLYAIPGALHQPRRRVYGTAVAAGKLFRSTGSLDGFGGGGPFFKDPLAV